MDRRTFLTGLSGAAAAPLLPALPAAAVPGVPPATAAPAIAWVVGIEERRHEVYWAHTLQDAIDSYRDDEYLCRCEQGEALNQHCGDDECEDCADWYAPEGRRAKRLDAIPAERRGKLRNAEYMLAGLHVRCDRCEDAGAYYGDDEGFSGDHYVVDGDTICDDCLCHEPHDVIRRANPDIYAETIDELLEAEYGPEIV